VSRAALLRGEFRDAAIELGDRQGELLAAHRVARGGFLPLELGSRQAERLESPLAFRVLDDVTAADSSLLQFVEAILDSRLGVNKSFRAVPHSLLFADPAEASAAP
jgi:hypothetical protein